MVHIKKNLLKKLEIKEKKNMIQGIRKLNETGSKGQEKKRKKMSHDNRGLETVCDLILNSSNTASQRCDYQKI